MEKRGTNSIQVTRGLEGVLKSVGRKMYEEWGQGRVGSVEEHQRWVTGTVKKVLMAEELETATIQYRQRKIAESISGRIGEVTYVDSKERQAHGRRLPSKPYKETAKRLIMQELMRRANAEWKKLDKKIKEDWIKAGRGKHIGGVHLFVGIYMGLLVDGEKIPSPLLPTRELMKYYQKRKSHR